MKFFGPKFNIELETAGKIRSQTKSEFETVGVNQTIHRIYLELDTAIGVLTPIDYFEENINSKTLLSEAVIVGKVPETYYNLEGIGESNAINLVE